MPRTAATPMLPIARGWSQQGYTRGLVDGRSLPGVDENAGAPERGAHASDPAEEDVELACALCRGDSRALEHAYEQHSRAVYSIALHLLADRGLAEEVVQETFLKLWRQPTAYQPERGRLQTWLLGVAHHRAVDLLRRRRTEQRYQSAAAQDLQHADREPLAQSAPSHDDPVQWLGALEQRLAVARALAGLPPEQRVPLEMAYYGGMTQAEIAAQLDLPLGTLKSRMRSALLSLRAAPGLVDAWRERA